MAAEYNHSRVELSISCRNLVDLDTFSKSDPMCVLYTLDSTRHWVEFGRTETISNNLNPTFSKSFVIDYRFEEPQPLRFLLVDVDNNNPSISAQDCIGEVTVQLADVLTAPGSTLTRNLYLSADAAHKNPRGLIVVRGEELSGSSDFAVFRFSGTKLDKKDFFGKSDPYLEIYKVQEDGDYTLVFRSEVVPSNLNPVWNPCKISISKLCGNDLERPLLVRCLDHNRSGNPSLIGEFKTTANQLINDHSKLSFELIEPKIKASKSSYRNSGLINVLQRQVIKEASFLDYIRGGCQINLVVAIDFTASNGAPNQPTSLHYRNPYGPNEYMEAISSVGSVLASYDSDQMFPVYGFGAKMPNGAVSHCFHCNGRPDPQVYGVDGIMQAYFQALDSVTLHGPTVFAPIINTVAGMAAAAARAGSQSYYVLLIITDGVINDLENTKDAIVNASKLPLSIVIVGVGAADFSAMDILDADDTPLVSSAGVTMSRDIVQFVPLRQFKSTQGVSKSIAAETLAEIPTQLVSYMQSARLQPGAPAPPQLQASATRAQFDLRSLYSS